MEIKGGVGSGIEGSRTISNVIENLDPKKRRILLDKLKQEKTKRTKPTPKQKSLSQPEIDSFIQEVIKEVKEKLK